MEKIKITFPDGSVREYEQGISSLEIANDISPRLAAEVLSATVNGEIWDLTRPINTDASVKLNKWDDSEGKYAFWHSSAHLMAEAVEAIYPGTKFGIGPPIENGFYYDIDPAGGTAITEADLPKIESKMRELAAQKEGFTRESVSKSDAVKYFIEKGDEYKLELIDGLEDGNITFYKQGNFTDLCRGPHIPNTSPIKAIKLLSVAGAYWRGDEHNKQLTRIYGITFPKKKMLDEYLVRLEEAKKRDHRKLGKELELFYISNNVGSGLPIWLPKGTILRETLENYLREEQRKRGYLPVITPHIGNINLYKTSGHYPYYKDSQFPPIQLNDGKEEYLLKPMNCPHHFQIYASKPRSYRDLPIRLAEFGTVYRYEQSGELNGLTRVRSFAVDDSHIFVRDDQLKDEVCNVIELIQVVFNQMGFKDFITELSFRDDNEEKYGGDIKLWESTERNSGSCRSDEIRLRNC